MLPKPRGDLVANTLAYEVEPLVKATGFREYDARWLFGSEINLLGVQALGLGLGGYIHELGLRRIWAQVPKHNPRALVFNRRLGFAVYDETDEVWLIDQSAA